jgi:hypothetical protein
MQLNDFLLVARYAGWEVRPLLERFPNFTSLASKSLDRINKSDLVLAPSRRLSDSRVEAQKAFSR